MGNVCPKILSCEFSQYLYCRRLTLEQYTTVIGRRLYRAMPLEESQSE